MVVVKARNLKFPLTSTMEVFVKVRRTLLDFMLRFINGLFASGVSDAAEQKSEQEEDLNKAR